MITVADTPFGYEGTRATIWDCCYVQRVNGFLSMLTPTSEWLVKEHLEESDTSVFMGDDRNLE